MITNSSLCTSLASSQCHFIALFTSRPSQVLEDELDISRVAGERHRAEGAGALEARGATRDGDAGPVLDGPLRRHVAAGDEAILGRGAVHVEGWNGRNTLKGTYNYAIM